MNVPNVLLWGFVGTVFLTGLMSVSQSIGLSRMSIPFLLGTIVTAERDRATFIGFLIHFINGWIFAFIYAGALESWGRATWYLGSSIGFVHGLFVLVAAMPILPGMHPRMASEEQGPSRTQQLQPPGFMALHYGRRTPLVTIASHLIFGGIIGNFYKVTVG
jgi:vacuolar-type H+-ATPase subunit I/STV1